MEFKQGSKRITKIGDLKVEELQKIRFILIKRQANLIKQNIKRNTTKILLLQRRIKVLDAQIKNYNTMTKMKLIRIVATLIRVKMEVA